MNISEISEWINQKATVQSDRVQQLNKKQNQIKLQTKFLSDLEEAREIIKNISTMTQEQVKYKIAEAGTIMLSSVFDPAPKIDVKFESKRNQTECEILFDRDGKLFSPVSEEGFGVCNIAGLGLRFAIYSLPARRSRPVMILDEPFCNLKGDEANIAAIEVIKKLSESLNIQVVMISDERVAFDEIKKGADRVMRVKMVDGKSSLEVVH